jgi:hypothetical protein
MRGFTYDPPDRDCGIFEGAWIHDPCPAGEDYDRACREWAELVVDGRDPGKVPEMAEVIDEELAVTRVNDVTVRTWHRLTCPECATQTIVTEDDFSPSDDYDVEIGVY